MTASDAAMTVRKRLEMLMKIETVYQWSTTRSQC